MNRFLGIFLSVILLSICRMAPAVANETTPKISDKIIAVVNEDVITQSDLDIALAAAIADLKEDYSGEELDARIAEARSYFFNQMIEDKLILQEAKRRGVIVDDSEVEERLNEIKSRFPEESIFEAEIERAGVTSDILRTRYKEQLMMTRLVSHEVKDRVVVTPAEISAYYDKHSKELKAPESVRLKAVIIRFDEATAEPLAKQKADDIFRLIKQGRDFSDLAKQYSQGPKAELGGDMGFIEKGQMREEFDKVIFNLKPGEVTEPLKTDTGYYIFKVEEKKGSYERSLADVREQIENTIYQEKAQNRYKEWIAKLKRDAFIQIK